MLVEFHKDLVDISIFRTCKSPVTYEIYCVLEVKKNVLQGLSEKNEVI